jgi:hypothetical protein
MLKKIPKPKSVLSACPVRRGGLGACCPIRRGGFFIAQRRRALPAAVGAKKLWSTSLPP